MMCASSQTASSVSAKILIHFPGFQTLIRGDKLIATKERACRAVHLGVMVGFAVVAPHFNPTDQVPQTMRTMCELPLNLIPRYEYYEVGIGRTSPLTSV